MAEEPVTVIAEGRFLRLVRKGRWEYVERTEPVGAAFIAAITKEGNLLLTREYRIPIGAEVIGFPAGLVGDAGGQEGEGLEDAVKRELEEEAGYTAERVELLTKGPTSAGQITEVIAVVLATGLRRVGPGGGTEHERIAVEEVPLNQAHAWLEARAAEGCLIDPKVYTGLYFIDRQSRNGSAARA